MPNTPIPPITPPDEIDEALNELTGAFADLLLPEQLEEARAFVRDALAGHPVGHLLAERVRTVVSVDRSAELTKEAPAVAEEEAPRKAGGEKL